MTSHHQQLAIALRGLWEARGAAGAAGWRPFAAAVAFGGVLSVWVGSGGHRFPPTVTWCSGTSVTLSPEIGSR